MNINRASLLFLMIIVCPLSLLSKEISLVFQVDRKNIVEEDWIMELLSGFDIKIIEDGDCEKIINNSIIVVQRHNFEYYRKLQEKNYKFGVIYLSDESCAMRYCHIPEFILKNYWHKNYSNDNVLVVPLGYKIGFWNNCTKNILSIRERPFNWSFAGQIIDKPTREIMVSHMKSVLNSKIYETSDFLDANGLSIYAYRELLLKSIFVPCPTGYVNMDSFRLYEALECGCIPIVETKPLDYFKKFLGDHPFISIESWDQAPKIISELLEDRALLERRRLECYNWWQNYKKELKIKVTDIVNEAFK